MLTLSRAVYDAVIDHARTGAPEEVCGVLGGDHGDGESEVDRALRAANVAASPPGPPTNSTPRSNST